MLHCQKGPLLIALAATAAVLFTIAPDARGPGVTCDELYHVSQGKQLVAELRQQGLSFFLPGNIRKNFRWVQGDPPIQAPLGYWILGGVHFLFDPSPDDMAVVSLTAARTAPAMAFGLLIALVGVWTARRIGAAAGTIAAAATAMTPRLFGHAHLASLDMLTTLFFVAAMFAVLEAARGGRNWQFALAGVIWGMAMLVRLHGMLVAPPVIVWMIWRCRRRAVAPLVCWLLAGLATLFVGWPWLWLAPWSHFRQYLATGTSREALHVFYAGHVWIDREVPWHYPWVMFAVVVPLGFLLLGIAGLNAWLLADRNERPEDKPLQRLAGRVSEAIKQPEGLLAAAMVFVLLVFSWPGTPVYDGVRLFLMVFPIWAVFTGLGADRLLQWSSTLDRLQSYGFRAAVFLLVLLQGIGLIVYYPCQLSHYNLLVGGLPGAVRLGFEATYWGDAVREPILAEAAQRSPGRPVVFAPNLAPFQAPAVTITSPALCRSETMLVGRQEAPADCRYAVVYHRRADLDDVTKILRQGRVVAEYGNQGVWLARLVELHTPLDAPGGHIKITFIEGQQSHVTEIRAILPQTRPSVGRSRCILNLTSIDIAKLCDAATYDVPRDLCRRALRMPESSPREK